MDFLKNLFNGQSLNFKQFTEAIGTSKIIKLVNLIDCGNVLTQNGRAA